MNIHLNFLLIIFCIYFLQPTNAYYYTLSSPLNWNWLTWSGQTSSSSTNETTNGTTIIGYQSSYRVQEPSIVSNNVSNRTKKSQYLLTERERGWLSVLANTILGVSRRRMIASSTSSIHRMAHVGRSMASTIDQTQTKQPTETIKQNIIVPTQSPTEMVSEYSTINYGNIVEHDQQTTMGIVSEYSTTTNYGNIVMEHDQQSTIGIVSEYSTTPTTYGNIAEHEQQSTKGIVSEYSTTQTNYGNIVEHDNDQQHIPARYVLPSIDEFIDTENVVQTTTMTPMNEKINMDRNGKSIDGTTSNPKVQMETTTTVNPLNEVETTPITMIKMKNPVFRLFNLPIEAAQNKIVNENEPITFTTTTTLSSIFEPNSERSIETTTPLAEMSDTTTVGDTKENETPISVTVSGMEPVQFKTEQSNMIFEQLNTNDQSERNSTLKKEDESTTLANLLSTWTSISTNTEQSSRIYFEYVDIATMVNDDQTSIATTTTTTTQSPPPSTTSIVTSTRSPKRLPFIVPYYDGQNFESNFQNIYSDSNIFNDLMVMNSNANLDQHELSSKIDGVESVGSLTNYQHLDSSWFIGNNQDK
ncbi:hypothetical protein RDWZM_010479 [Blomia tropicalis]|uniref:Uncharacterized protein n=1 Tax=Blomia tropicalis TaxID=40697 RepID=A0A9Q0RIQ7_BLOTA|nr:hypothetical protein RDWZM_010479 [Blomia tropicalis]